MRGRIHTTLALAYEFDAVAILWSTGATWLPDGTSEARYMFNQARSMYPERSIGRGGTWLRDISWFDEESLNTAHTMSVARRLMFEHYPKERVMLHHVSSDNHMPRVIRDATKVFGDMPGVILSGVPAQTSYGRKTPADVVIYELGEPPK